MTKVKTLGIEALRATFDDQYPVAEFRGLHASLEYPVKSIDLPEVWVRYTDTEPLQQSGVAHIEDVAPGLDVRVAPYTRWRFKGAWEFIVVALSSYERDRVYDELIRVIAFSQQGGLLGRFRSYIEHNDLIDLTARVDEIESTGESAEPGTPWGTDEVVYERTLNIDLIGDFCPDPETGNLVPLSRIDVIPTPQLGLGAESSDGFNDWH
ncbi:hypothetical protein ACFZAM_31285 [Streptomyces sp. NPDC008079]|uniref:hypothetical protein n=1 Tax=Streptomyces sp. NPDC008079 TaxID=3364806 RepID=UPI0036E13FF7